ncbi:MAG: prohibitin family protein [Verrucomicrobiia bacterium]
MEYTQNQNSSAKFIIITIFSIIVLLAALGFLLSCWAIIPPGHRGVSVILGKVNPSALPEGFTFKRPFVETIIKVPIQQLTVSGTTSCFSSDLQTVNIAYSVLYRLPESKVVELYQQFAGDPYHTLVEPRLQEAIKQVTAQFRAEDVVKNREKIKQTALLKLQQELAGLVDVRDVPITNIDLTDELERAIELKQVTEQQALAKVYELQKAQRDAEITIVNAKAEAEAVRIKGEALANSPRVVDLEIAKRWNGQSPQSVVVSQGGANVLLPLR